MPSSLLVLRAVAVATAATATGAETTGPAATTGPAESAPVASRASTGSHSGMSSSVTEHTTSEAACVSIASPSNGAPVGEDVQSLDQSDAQSQSVEHEWERENTLDQTLDSQFRSFEDSSCVCDKKEEERTGPGRGGKKGRVRGGGCT